MALERQGSAGGLGPACHDCASMPGSRRNASGGQHAALALAGRLPPPGDSGARTWAGGKFDDVLQANPAPSLCPVLSCTAATSRGVLGVNTLRLHVGARASERLRPLGPPQAACGRAATARGIDEGTLLLRAAPVGSMQAARAPQRRRRARSVDCPHAPPPPPRGRRCLNGHHRPRTLCTHHSDPVTPTVLWLCNRGPEAPHTMVRA